MIQIVDKADCCGCSACMAVCPKKCITLKEDEEGFLYPKVDRLLCVDCDLCCKVCPVLHPGTPREPQKVFAAKNPDDEMRLKSSSGGIFTLLAEKVLEMGGVVFGARFDEHWNVVHDFTETKDGLSAFRGSKYVQSRMGNCYVEAKQFLQNGRVVMFTGTSCQILGLKNFLRKEYDNLLTVDVICHGVPSPKAWRLYLNEECRRIGTISSVDFRSKIAGWKNFRFVITSTHLRQSVKEQVKNVWVVGDNLFMASFLRDMCLRPSCHACPAKTGKSGSDITIGDFWGIENVMPDFDDDKGVSCVICFSVRGEKWLATLKLNCKPAKYSDALPRNPNLLRSVEKPANRDRFFWRLKRKNNFHYAAAPYFSHSFFWRLYRLVQRKLKYFRFNSFINF